jgi:hypothetical protein
VGGGYGALAEHLFRQYKINKYYLLDHPVLQVLQGYYLTKAGHGMKISFEVPSSRHIDLIVSTNSLCEMPIEEVTKYIKLFEATLKRKTGLMFLLQRKKRGIHILTSWDDYPFSNDWKIDVVPHVRNKSHQIECYGRLR